MIKSFKDLNVWNNAMELVENSYKITQSFPDNEKYGVKKSLKSSIV